jgi:hypothetical protein
LEGVSTFKYHKEHGTFRFFTVSLSRERDFTSLDNRYSRELRNNNYDTKKNIIFLYGSLLY